MPENLCGLSVSWCRWLLIDKKLERESGLSCLVKNEHFTLIKEKKNCYLSLTVSRDYGFFELYKTLRKRR